MSSAGGMPMSAGGIQELLDFFYRTPDIHNRRNEAIVKPILAQVKSLLAKDYVVGTIANEGGELCPSYPSSIFVLQEQRPQHRSSSATSLPNLSSSFSSISPPRDTLESNGSRRGSMKRAAESDLDEAQAGSSRSSRSGTEVEASRSNGTAADDLDISNGAPIVETPRPRRGSRFSDTIFPMTDIDEDPLVSDAESSDRRIPSQPVPRPRSSSFMQHNDPVELRRLILECKFSRVRSRFAVPVILCRGQNICRSATLAHEAEIWMNMASDNAKSLIFGSSSSIDGGGNSFIGSSSSINGAAGGLRRTATDDGSDQLTALNKQRRADIELLKWLDVRYIVDLMVENRKVKYYLNVCSSEKADSEGRYTGEFTLVTIPYPGCEFFKDFRDKGHCARGLKYDWYLPFVNAEISVPGHADEFAAYKEWDLAELTQKYLQLMITLAVSGSSTTEPGGMLIHCISGWDRTPLFTSLIRMSLWADGEAHASLTATEMLYLTLGYDWLLFGHLLADRSQKGEDILLFCFYFLSLMEGPEFSLAVMDWRASAEGEAAAAADDENAAAAMPEHHEKSAAVPVPRSQAQDINGRHHREPSDELSTSWSFVHSGSFSFHGSMENRLSPHALPSAYSPEATAGAAPPPVAFTISTCGCCGALPGPADGGGAFSRAVQSSLARRRHRLRQLRSLFMQAYKGVRDGGAGGAARAGGFLGFLKNIYQDMM